MTTTVPSPGRAPCGSVPIAGSPGGSDASSVVLCGRGDPALDPRVEIAETAAQIVDEMERHAGGAERPAAAADEETEQLAIDHQDGGDRQRGDRGGLAPQDDQRQASGRDACQRNARALAGPQVEIGGTAASLEDQPRPGNGAPSEIGAHHRLERPPLEVRPLQLLVQKDAVAGGSQAIPELDVLDRWLGVTLLVEPTD